MPAERLPVAETSATGESEVLPTERNQ